MVDINAPRCLGRREFLSQAGSAFLWVGLGAARGTAAESFDELSWLPAWSLRERIGRKEISPVEVVDHFLRRIERLDGRLQSFVSVAADQARAAAVVAEAAVMSGAALGPLHGVPVSFKHLIQVAGLPLPDGRIPARDYVTAERIRRAGAIVIGNTAMAGPPDASGAANPWDTERAAGASSSGAAASVAAGLGPLAIGSDGGGSTRIPSSYCGLVGLHPTVGRVPAHHDVWTSVSRTGWSGTYGPICRDVRDAALLLGVIAGPDWRHLFSFNGAPPDYQMGLEGGVAQMRMAWTPDFGCASAYFDDESRLIVDTVRRAAEGFGELGAIVDQPAFAVDDWYPIFTTITGNLSARVARPGSGAEGNRAAAAAVSAGEGFAAALKAREEMARTFLGLFARYDVLLSPTTHVVAPTRDEWGRWLQSPTFPPEYTCLTGHLNLLGFPAVTLPCGFVGGMPVGLQIVGPPDQDGKLLRVARAFTTAFPQKHVPKIT